MESSLEIDWSANISGAGNSTKLLKGVLSEVSIE